VVWVEQIGSDQWSIALGVPTFSYQRALDWQLDFKVFSTPTGRQVEVTTPTVATRDGTQVHKREYSEVRDLVLTGLASGRLPAPTTEVAASRAGLARPPTNPLGLRAGAEARERVVRTQLAVPAIWDRLALLCYPMIERSDTTRAQP
jgi:hypothetical protein